MASIITNSSAMTALQSLTATNKNLEQTQNGISTGYRVATAADNAAYWSIATTMRSDNSAMSTVNDALGLGASTVDVASAALTTTIDLASQIKTKLVAASEPGVDRSKIQAEIAQLQSQLQSVADSAAFSGQNWLSDDTTAAGYNAIKSIVSSFTRSATGVSVGKLTVDTSNTLLLDSGAQTGILDKAGVASGVAIISMDISALTDSAADQTILSNYITDVDTAITEMTDAAATLGATKTRIGLQQDFINSLMDAVDKGIGQLVDADMNKESTRLQALQVQQQLGVQALSIANSTGQSILSLFK